jgi:hypothetical protein
MGLARDIVRRVVLEAHGDAELATERLMAWLNSDAVTESTLGDLLRELHASPAQARSLAPELASAMDTVDAQAAGDDGRARRMIRELLDPRESPTFAGVTERAIEQMLLLPLLRMILDEADRFPIDDE